MSEWWFNAVSATKAIFTARNERDMLNLIVDIEDKEILVEAPALMIYNALSLDKNDTAALLSSLPLDFNGIVVGNCLTSFRYNH